MATLAGCSGDPSAVALPDAAALDAAGDTAMSDVLDASDAPDAAPSIDVTSDAAPVDDSVQPSPVDSTVAPPRDAAMDATPPPPDVPCTAGLSRCDRDCVDLARSPAHCGRCGGSCAPGQSCVDGRCALVCPVGETVCAGACRDLSRDVTHCGACGAACPSGQSCVGGRCALVCPTGQSACAGACRDFSTDNAHCGACGVSCSAGRRCSEGRCGVTCADGLSVCDEACANTRTNPEHCGACGVVCAIPNAVPRCAEGRCVVGMCNTGFADCDGDTANGCEVDTRSATNHCGGCGRSCPAVADGAPTCVGGACGVRCDPGFTACGGACVNLRESASHCGACGAVCAAGANASALCAEGRCRSECRAGFGDCDGDPANGCEVDLRTSAAHCGACRGACPAPPNGGAVCAAGVCGVRCDAGFSDCDGACVNLQSSPSHCGACARECPAGQGCAAGRCQDRCDAPNLRCASACIDPGVNPSHCGACGNVCPGAANATATCAGGSCGLLCRAGFGDCDGSAGSGCESSLLSDVSHCGACNNICRAGSNSAVACVSGRCQYTCSTGFGDCDANATNGCEVDTRSSTTHCGACGNVCASGSNGTPACVSGACSVTCAVGHGNCDGNATNGCEVDIRGSIAHCGRCGNACSAGANASPACLAGACALACRTGYANCDGSAANGCEVDTRSDTAHCGACGRRCQTGANATATCALGVCGVTCGAGFANCDGDAANGCEADLRLDTAHCGACGRACSIANGSSRCASGACSYTCNAGFHLVGGVCVADGGVRPVQPTSLGDVTQRRPTLRWALPTGADGAVVELCRDRACASVIETLRVTGTSARPVTTLPARSVVFWRARARVGTAEDAPAAVGPTWLFHTPAADAANGVDTSFNAHFDVNGDGFDDVVVGASYADPGDRLNAGTASVFHGSASGVATTPVLVLEGVGPDDGFGGSVSGAGDVNGDGFADLVVGSVRADPGGRLNAGTASVFYGSTGGLAATPGRVLEGVASDDWFGGSVSGAGDVNGDGFADLVVGSLGADPGGRRDAGAARVFLGSAIGVAATPARVFEGVGPNDRFGGSVSGAGDVNGDGFADLVVGALQADPGGRRDAGTASVFHGSPSGVATAPARVLEGVASDDWFGRVSSAGDVNGDGFADLVVGAMQADPSGRFNPGSASVYHGSPDGVAAAPARVLEGAGENNAFGYSVASARDVNGDGFADLVVGSIYANGGDGTASVFHGSASGVAATPARVLVPIATNRFGHSVAGAGDVNSDGFADLIVGALGTAGSASVFHGSASGVAATPARVLVGVDPEDRFGDSVASVPPPKPRWRAAVLPRYDTAQPATPRARRAPGRACATESPRWGRGRRPT